MKKYRVEIVEIDTGKVVSVIGRNIPEHRVERRIESGLMRCNTDKYFVRDVEERATKEYESANS